MTPKHKILSSIFIISLFGFLCIPINAQDTNSENRISFSLGYSRYVVGKKTNYPGGILNTKNITTGNLRLETNYLIRNFLEAGVYIGIANYEFIRIGENGASFTTQNYLTPSYGLSVKLESLSLITSRDDLRLNLYLSGKYGGQYFFTPSNTPSHGNKPEYGIGLGASYYFWRHAGIFGEYSLGKYYYNSRTNVRYGICINF